MRSQVLSLSTSQLRVVRALARLHYLTARQAAGLLYAPSSLSYVQEALTGLFRQSLVTRHLRQRRTRAGSVEYVYTLSPRGYHYLDLSGEPARTPLPSTQIVTDLFLEHAVLVTDLLILVDRLPRVHPAARILRFEDQFDLRRLLSRARVVPDGFVEVALGAESFPLAFELDRGTLSRERLQDKVMGLLAWCQTGYPALFGTDALSVAFVTTAGNRRIEAILKVVEQASARMAAEEQAQRFFVTGKSLIDASPAEFFLGATWQRPGSQTLEPLLIG